MKTATLFVLLLGGLVSGVTRLADAKPVIRKQMLVSTDWLARHLNDKDLVVLFVGRDSKGYESGHIPGARFLKYTDIVATRDGVANELPLVTQLEKAFSAVGVQRSSRIVLHCDGQGLLAARAYFTLDYLGMGNQTSLLDGGLEKWKAEKRTVATAPATFAPTAFSARINPAVLVPRAVVQDISADTSGNSGYILVDARPPDVYDGTTSRAELKMAGHIPGARNHYWMKSLVSSEMPQMRPVDELEKLLGGAGISAEKKVVTYCWIGMMASYDYFLLKYLGYDVGMYDGSFTDWAKAQGATAIPGKDPYQK